MNDPLFHLQWGLHLIQAQEAWAISDGEGAVIAIIDSGIDLKHADLASQLLKNRGRDFVEPDAPDGPQDENSHGTSVAGIAAAVTGNALGIAGVAPRARIMPIRVCDEGGTCDNPVVARGILYAAKRGADVINISLGGGYVTSRLDMGEGPLDHAVRKAWEKGAVIVASAGNEVLPICSEPAATPNANAICVGATDRNDLPAAYSNSDAVLMTNYLVAPGGNGLDALPNQAACEGGVLSTYLRSAQHTSCSPGRGFDVGSGTSLATPFVSGVAALLVSQGLTNDQVLETILATADDLGTPGRDPRFGFGRVNALNAVKRGATY
ncbi:MAG: S8 family serine peptidase [Actinomycetota bacterium]